MHGRQRVGGMNGGNTHVECCVRRHTGQATLLALRDTNRDRPARDRARPQRLPAPGLTRPFPWQEAGDLKTLASMQARPVTPHVAEKPLAPGRGGAEYGARQVLGHRVSRGEASPTGQLGSCNCANSNNSKKAHAARAPACAHLLLHRGHRGGKGQRDLPPSPPALLRLN